MTMELPTAGDCTVLGWAYDTHKFLVLGRKVNEDGQTVYVVGEVDEIGPDVPLRGNVYATSYLARRIWAGRINGASPETPGRSPGVVTDNYTLSAFRDFRTVPEQQSTAVTLYRTRPGEVPEKIGGGRFPVAAGDPVDVMVTGSDGHQYEPAGPWDAMRSEWACTARRVIRDMADGPTTA